MSLFTVVAERPPRVPIPYSPLEALWKALSMPYGPSHARSQPCRSYAESGLNMHYAHDDLNFLNFRMILWIHALQPVSSAGSSKQLAVSESGPSQRATCTNLRSRHALLHLPCPTPTSRVPYATPFALYLCIFSSERLAAMHRPFQSKQSGCQSFSPNRPQTQDSSLVSWFSTASCMDLNRRSQNDQHPQHYLRARRSWSDQHDVPEVVSPVASRLWDQVPISYRPRDWRPPADPRSPVSPLTPAPLFDRSSSERTQHRTISRWRRRQRPSTVHNAYGNHDYETMADRVRSDTLHPRASPDDDCHSIHSAPDQLQHFSTSVSQPNSPRSMPFMYVDGTNEPPLSMIPCSPTYPSAGRRCARRTTNLGEGTFTDAEDFHLFVQATSGLGPEQPFRSLSTALGSPGDGGGMASIRSTDMESAPMPRGSHTSSPALRPRPRRLVTDERCTRTSGVDLWLQPPTATWEESEASGDGDGDGDDDELPDYAASQAQAQAQQRAEAARRAQELARRWQRSR